jgi:hypothetical protein
VCRKYRGYIKPIITVGKTGYTPTKKKPLMKSAIVKVAVDKELL